MGVSRGEWRWAATIAIVTVALSSLPYAAGYLAQTQGERFVGAVLDLEDYHSHLAKMWQGYRGAWRYRLLFTPEPHAGAYLQVFYVALGQLARILRLGVPLTYHLARISAGLVMLLVIYRFVALFAVGEIRRVAFVLAATSSGLGWLVEAIYPTPPGGISPIDFWLMDAYTFFSLFTFPHFCAAVALLLSVYAMLLRLPETTGAMFAQKGRVLGAILITVILSWGLGLIHPYAMLLIDLIPGLYMLWRTATERRLPVPLLIALVCMSLTQAPLLLYDYRVFSTEPVFQAWATQNVTLSPPFAYYLLGFGIVVVLAVWGIRPALVACRHAPFLLLWVVASFILAYLPWGLQRRFVEGVHVALCVLAGYGLTRGLMPVLARPLSRVARFLDYHPGRFRWLVQALVVAVAALSNLYLVTSATVAVALRQPALFRSLDEVRAAEWLDDHSTWDQTVLSSYETSNWIVGAVGHRVFWGHWAESIHLPQKREEAQRFFTASQAFERRDFLSRYDVAYVFYGPRERELGDFDPAGATYLERVFRQGEVTVYRVALGGES